MTYECLVTYLMAYFDVSKLNLVQANVLKAFKL